MDGSKEMYKACLFAKCNTRKEGVQENVLPWSKVCLDLSNSYIVAYLDLELFQMDVQTTFLSGKLNKEINMDELIDFEGKEKKKQLQV